MGFGFKYHVVTVAAIFFALAVGLVVGSLLLSPKIADQQASQIRKLQAIVAQDFSANRAQKEIDERAIADLVPVAIKGRLIGSSVAVIQTGNYPDAVAAVRDAITQADGEIVSVTTIDHEMDRPDALLVPELVSLSKSEPGIPTDRAAMASQIATIIAKGDNPPNLEPVLERENYVHSDASLGYKSGARYCVIVAGTQPDLSNRILNVDQPLIAALQKLGVTVLMCEPSDAHVSDVDEYHRQGIAVTTIDNIDDAIGKASLVYAMGGEVGNYGVKPDASALLPPELKKAGSR